jgi:hypothetical protein
MRDMLTDPATGSTLSQRNPGRLAEPAGDIVDGSLWERAGPGCTHEKGRRIAPPPDPVCGLSST